MALILPGLIFCFQSFNSNNLPFLVDVFWHSESLVFISAQLMQMPPNLLLLFPQRFQTFPWYPLDWQLTGNSVNATSYLPFELTVRVSYLPFRLLACLFQYLCRPSVSLFLKYVSSLPGCCPAVYYLILSLITSSWAIGDLITVVFPLRLWSVTLLSAVLPTQRHH